MFILCSEGYWYACEGTFEENVANPFEIRQACFQISGMPIGTLGKGTVAATRNLAAITQMASGLMANGVVRCGAQPSD